MTLSGTTTRQHAGGRRITGADLYEGEHPPIGREGGGGEEEVRK